MEIDGELVERPGFAFVDGDLFFDITILGDYVISVTSDEEDPENPVYLPTYLPQTFLWEEADTLEFRNVSLVADLAMTPTPGELDPNNEGRILGILEIEVPDEEGLRDQARRRAKKVRCHVRRNTGGGRDEQEGTYILVASIETNDNGEYDFPNLPPGLYRINFEYPGVPMDPDSFIEFEVGIGDDASVQIAGLIAEAGSIIVEEVMPVGVTPGILDELKIYPNPASNMLNLEYKGLNSNDVSMYVMDMSGRQVLNQSLPRAVKHTHTLDVSGMDGGLYFITIREDNTGEVLRSFKVLIRK